MSTPRAQPIKTTNLKWLSSKYKNLLMTLGNLPRCMPGLDAFSEMEINFLWNDTKIGYAKLEWRNALDYMLGLPANFSNS